MPRRLSWAAVQAELLEGDPELALGLLASLELERGGFMLRVLKKRAQHLGVQLGESCDRIAEPFQLVGRALDSLAAGETQDDVAAPSRCRLSGHLGGLNDLLVLDRRQPDRDRLIADRLGHWSTITSRHSSKAPRRRMASRTRLSMDCQCARR